MKKIRLHLYQKNLEEIFKKEDKILCLWGRMTGKTFMAAYLAAKCCFKNVGVNVGVITPHRLQSFFINQIAQYYHHSQPFWSKIIRFFRCLKQRILGRQHDSRMFIIDANFNACRGFHLDVLILDSCEMIPEAIFELGKLMVVDGGKFIIFSNATYTDHWIYKVFKTGVFSKSQVKTSENPKVDVKLLNNIQRMLGIDEFKRNFCINFMERPKNLRKPDYVG